MIGTNLKLFVMKLSVSKKYLVFICSENPVLRK